MCCVLWWFIRVACRGVFGLTGRYLYTRHTSVAQTKRGKPRKLVNRSAIFSKTSTVWSRHGSWLAPFVHHIGLGDAFGTSVCRVCRPWDMRDGSRLTFARVGIYPRKFSGVHKSSDASGARPRCPLAIHSVGRLPVVGKLDDETLL